MFKWFKYARAGAKLLPIGRKIYALAKDGIQVEEIEIIVTHIFDLVSKILTIFDKPALPNALLQEVISSINDNTNIYKIIKLYIKNLDR